MLFRSRNIKGQVDLCPLGENTGKQLWDKVVVTADSGAGEHVCPPTLFPQVPVRESEGSKKGVTYKVANGESIPNKGEKKIEGQNSNGVPMNIKAQVAKVSKFLASIGKMVKAGNKIVMDENDSYIQNKKTGLRTPMRLENNVFVFDLWVEKDSAEPFPRQAQ